MTWNNSLPCLFSRFLSERVRAEIFADPTWLYANATRPSGKAVVEGDSYRVSGRWSLVSGCELAEWIPLMCLIEEARDTIDAMYATAGTSALYVDSPLERAHRDIHAMLRHIIAQPTWLEQAGRVAYGLPPSELLFGI